MAEEILANMIRTVYVTWKGRFLFLQRVPGFHPFITPNSRNLSRNLSQVLLCPEQSIQFIFSTRNSIHPGSFQASCVALPCFTEHLTEMQTHFWILTQAHQEQFWL